MCLQAPYLTGSSNDEFSPTRFLRIKIFGLGTEFAPDATQPYVNYVCNLLWPVLSALTGEDLAGTPYAERLPRLLAHGFGLWDVLGACERAGSLDSAIRKPAANDFARLRELCPSLETVGFNGQTSGKFAPQFAAAGYRTLVWPSTSPAHASLTFEQKIEHWKRLR